MGHFLEASLLKQLMFLIVDLGKSSDGTCTVGIVDGHCWAPNLVDAVPATDIGFVGARFVGLLYSHVRRVGLHAVVQFVVNEWP